MTATLTNKEPGGERTEAPPKPVAYMHHRSFSLPQTARRLWGPDRERIEVPPYSLLPEVEPAEAAPSGGAFRLSPDQERTLFLRYNYAKYRLHRLQVGRQRPADRAEQMALWRRRAEETREKLVHANLPLVPTMARRTNVRGVEFAELISEGYMAVMRSVEKFDVARGFKFSTYACRAILAGFHRLASKAQTAHKHVPAYFEPSMERSDYDVKRHEQQLGDVVDTIREVLRENQAHLAPMEREVLERRFPMWPHGRPRTLAQVGQSVGLSNERVRQIEQASLRKLRVAIEDHLAA